MDTLTTEVSEETFGSEVVTESSPVLVAFYDEEDRREAERTLSPLEMLAEMNLGRVKCCRVNVRKFAQFAKEYRLRSLPSFLLFKEGEVCQRVEGHATPRVLNALVNRYA